MAVPTGQGVDGGVGVQIRQQAGKSRPCAGKRDGETAEYGDFSSTGSLWPPVLFYGGLP